MFTSVESTNLPVTRYISKHIDKYISSASSHPNTSIIPDSLHPHLVPLFSSFLRHLAQIESRCNASRLLTDIHSKTHLPPLASASVLSLVIIWALKRAYAVRKTATLLATLVGVVGPCVRSLKAVEAPKRDDDERFLTYCTYSLLYFSNLSAYKQLPLFS